MWLVLCGRKPISEAGSFLRGDPNRGDPVFEVLELSALLGSCIEHPDGLWCGSKRELI